LSGGPGQDDPEEAALSLLTLELDAPSLGFDRPPRHGEAQSESARVAGAAGVDAIEALEDPFAMLSGDAGSGIVHLDGRLARRRRRHPDRDRAVLRGVLDGVVEEIAQTLSEDGGVARGHDIPADIDTQALRLFLGEDPHGVGNAAGEPP